MKLEPNFISKDFEYKVWSFPSGELGVQILSKNITSSYTIKGSVLSSDHLMELLQLREALGTTSDIDLIMPYCAYSRQDRRCNPGESFSLKVFADLINSCNFKSVTTYDNHSDVATALINNCGALSASTILTKHNRHVANMDYLISPDAGANKKVFDCSQKFNIPMIRADKVRDVSTGNITSTDVFATPEQLANKTVLIIDDICAGGRTFVELAKALKAVEPSVTIHLYVTHGFFSSGFHNMVDAGISKFITTDSVIYSNYLKDVTSDGTVTVIDI